MRTILSKIFRKLKHLSLNKQDAELLFWTSELKSYQQWYDGKVSILHNTKNPNLSEKIDAPNQKDASILTWHKLHQEKKYLIDLDLDANVFHGMKILDIGSGPIPSATCFTNCQVYCLDPLLHKYLQAGYPLHYYENVKFIQGVSEKIPFKNDFLFPLFTRSIYCTLFLLNCLNFAPRYICIFHYYNYYLPDFVTAICLGFIFGFSFLDICFNLT